MSENAISTEEVLQEKLAQNIENIDSYEEDIEVSQPIQSGQPKKSLTAEEAAKRIKKLSDENKEWRKEQRAQKQLMEETQARLKELEVKTQERLINAEIKVVAQKLKFRDFLDLKKLADLSTVKMLENGDIAGIEEAAEALKKSRPYLCDLGTTSSIGNAPARSQQPEKSLRDMTPSEYKVAKSAYLKG